MHSASLNEYARREGAEQETRKCENISAPRCRQPVNTFTNISFKSADSDKNKGEGISQGPALL